MARSPPGFSDIGWREGHHRRGARRVLSRSGALGVGALLKIVVESETLRRSRRSGSCPPPPYEVHRSTRYFSRQGGQRRPTNRPRRYGRGTRTEGRWSKVDRFPNESHFDIPVRTHVDCRGTPVKEAFPTLDFSATSQSFPRGTRTTWLDAPVAFSTGASNSGCFVPPWASRWARHSAPARGRRRRDRAPEQ